MIADQTADVQQFIDKLDAESDAIMKQQIIHLEMDIAAMTNTIRNNRALISHLKKCITKKN